ncbi:MAG: hypothetical protein KAI17_03275 [Thiotrichaceae bacterium]|nr:hypothetical protein [Thiotrichaceae bacterium]
MGGVVSSLFGGGQSSGLSGAEMSQQEQLEAQQKQEQEEAFQKFKLSQRAQFGASDFGTNLSRPGGQSSTLGQ